MSTDASRYSIEFDLPEGIDPGPVVKRLRVFLRSTDASMVAINPVLADKAEQAEPDHQPCPECSEGHIAVASSKRRGGRVVQYLECWNCGWKPADGKRVVPADAVPRRRTRNKPAL